MTFILPILVIVAAVASTAPAILIRGEGSSATDELTVMEGETVTFFCDIISARIIENFGRCRDESVIWATVDVRTGVQRILARCNDTRLNESRYSTFVRDGMYILRIANVQRFDSTRYKCRVRSNFTREFQVAQLWVKSLRCKIQLQTFAYVNEAHIRCSAEVPGLNLFIVSPNGTVLTETGHAKRELNWSFEASVATNFDEFRCLAIYTRHKTEFIDKCDVVPAIAVITADIKPNAVEIFEGENVRFTCDAHIGTGRFFYAWTLNDSTLFWGGENATNLVLSSYTRNNANVCSVFNSRKQLTAKSETAVIRVKDRRPQRVLKSQLIFLTHSSRI